VAALTDTFCGAQPSGGPDRVAYRPQSDAASLNLALLAYTSPLCMEFRYVFARGQCRLIRPIAAKGDILRR
jgi:hypothetical protein